MTKLQHWMTKHDKRDAEVARAVKRSRPQISRIRRGLSTPSVKTALRLDVLTGIRWWNFVQAADAPKRKAKP